MEGGQTEPDGEGSMKDSTGQTFSRFKVLGRRLLAALNLSQRDDSSTKTKGRQQWKQDSEGNKQAKRIYSP